MTTGNFADWDGKMMDLGPIYPFVGWEVPMVIVCAIFWIGWHIWQIRMENRTLETEAANLRKDGNLQRALQTEHSVERM